MPTYAELSDEVIWREQERLAKGKALHHLRQGIRNLIQVHPDSPMTTKLRKLLEESHEKECWND